LIYPVMSYERIGCPTRRLYLEAARTSGLSIGGLVFGRDCCLLVLLIIWMGN
jgi:hypothetical protein